MPAIRTLLPNRMRLFLSQAVRLGLPLGALVLMSTIFLASRSVDPNVAVEMSGLDLVALTREPRIGAARIAGMTADNAAITISAAALRSVSDLQARAPLHLTLDRPTGTVIFTGGGDVSFKALSGQVDQSTNTVTLTQDVGLRASNGYDVTMDTLRANLERAVIDGIGPVAGTGPAGRLSANSLQISALHGETGGYLLAFKGDVRLLYIP